MTNNYPIKLDYSNLKTYIINLDDYISNYTKQLPYLLNIGLHVERFSGVNALKNEHLKPEYQQYISSFAKNFVPKSVIVCALSHILCCKHIKSNYSEKTNDPMPYFLIMEDDAFPLYNSEEFYKHLNKSIYEIQLLDSKWDIIQLHSDGFFPTKDTYNTHIICGSAAAYLISLNGINKTLNKFGRDKVIFLEPTPQSEDKLIEKYQTYKYDRYPLEERIVQQEIFYKALNSYNLNVIKMKNAIGVDVLTDQYTDDGCHLNDKYSYVLAEYINKYLDIPFLPPTH